MSLRYFGFITLQPVYPEEPQRANTEKRGNGGVQMEGAGQESKGCCGKAPPRCGCHRARAFQKQQGEGSSALMKTSGRGLDAPPRSPPTTGDGMFRNPKESPLLLGNTKSNHARAVLTRSKQGGREHLRDSQAAPAKYSSHRLPEPSVPRSPASVCLWLHHLGLL